MYPLLEPLLVFTLGNGVDGVGIFTVQKRLAELIEWLWLVYDINGIGEDVALLAMIHSFE